MESFCVDLTNGVVLEYRGPQRSLDTGIDVFFGTVGDRPDYNNAILDELHRQTQDEVHCWGGPGSEVTLLAGGSSSWVLLQFIEARRDWLVHRLRTIVSGGARRPTNRRLSRPQE